MRFPGEFSRCSRLTWGEKRGDTYLGVVEFPILNFEAADREAGNYYNEFLMFPKKEMAAKWKNLIQDRLGRDWMSANSERVQELNQQISNKEIFERIESIENFFFAGMNNYGGGTNDGRTLYVFPRLIGGGVHSTIRNILKSGPPKSRYGSSRANGRNFLQREHLWGLLLQMRVISAFLEKNQKKVSDLEGLDDLYRLWISEGTAEMETNLKNHLLNLMLEFEHKIHFGLQYEMTAERLFKDMMSKDFTTTTSFQYYSKVALEGSIEHLLFINDQFKSKPKE